VGIKEHKIFVCRNSLIIDVLGVKSYKAFVNTLWNVIRQRGAMDIVIRDSAAVKISNKVKDVLHCLFIKDWASEPSFQHQNYCERHYQNVKHNTQHVMNCLHVPVFGCLLCLENVVFVMNYTGVESLKRRTPIERLTG